MGFSLSLKTSFYALLLLNLAFLAYSSGSVLKANTPTSSKWLEPYRITIYNRDVPDVVVGCDDRGAELLRPGNSISWKFRMNFRDTTSYNCRFYWFREDNSVEIRKQIEFPVFDDEIIGLCGHNLFAMNRCNWYITMIGFYFSKTNASFPSGDWRIMHVWNNI